MMIEEKKSNRRYIHFPWKARKFRAGKGMCWWIPLGSGS